MGMASKNRKRVGTADLGKIYVVLLGSAERPKRSRMSIAAGRSRMSSARVVVPLAVGLVLYGVILFAGNRLLNDPDSYWHLVVGRWIVEHRAFPTADPFSFTMTGAPWIA